MTIFCYYECNNYFCKAFVISAKNSRSLKLIPRNIQEISSMGNMRNVSCTMSRVRIIPIHDLINRQYSEHLAVSASIHMFHIDTYE